jgi:hypothetical protein
MIMKVLVYYAKLFLHPVIEIRCIKFSSGYKTQALRGLNNNNGNNNAPIFWE